ncbi:MAG: NAD(+)/NADH kinase [Aigarchaeota archaeon]|nr:NAD(+)/NADH kinase [Aigarchaeota archaeon]MDW8092905.1 NAD(+)/NADH kinase [Nitrososphaerota archaeon]
MRFRRLLVLVSRSDYLKRVSLYLSDLTEIDVSVIEDASDLRASEEDLLMVVGDDREVLNSLHALPSLDVNVINVGIESTKSFLTSASIDDLEEVIGSVIRGNFRIDRVPLLRLETSEASSGPAINEAIICPQRTATILQYTLSVDGELIWKDRSDGVIVSTSLGSTAYALSAGGSLIHHSAPVFEVVPVNSLDLTRRPLVVSANSEISIDEIHSSVAVEAVIDGFERLRVADSLKIKKYPVELRFVRPTWVQPISNRMERKIMLARSLIPLPPSAKLILRVLEYEGSMNYDRLLESTALPERTLRYGLNRLISAGLVRRLNDPSDIRKKLYEIVKDHHTK